MSTITVINHTSETVRIAIYQKPVVQPTLATIAWQIIEPPPDGGQTVVNVPSDYQAYANYSYNTIERNDPDSGNRTAVLPFSENTARFVISSVTSQDQHASAASIKQVFTDLVMNEVRMENQFNYGVWSHITKSGQDIYAPQILWPGGVRMEDIRSTLYLAVVAQFVTSGSRLLDEEISITETPVVEGGSATVTGSMWAGYSIATTSG